jgi:HD superfamily phosphohydrolase
VSLRRWIDRLIANGVTNREDSGTETRRIDTLKYLSNIQRSQIDARQKLEWRVFFTALTFYVLVPVAVNTKGIVLPKEWWLVAALYVVFTSTIVFFLWRIQNSHNSNKYAGELAEDLLWKSIGQCPSAIFNRKLGVDRMDYIRRRARVYFGLQILMLIVFAVVSFFTATIWTTP